MEWFRFYHDAVNDPKVQRLPPVLFKHWINVLCLASSNSERGTLPSVTDLAFGLRLSEAKVRAILAELVAAGLVDRDRETFRMHGWANRQKRSDDVTARVNKYRAGNGDETLQETFHETAPETLHATLPHVRVKNRDRTETEQNRADNPPVVPPNGDADQPFDLLEALCGEIGSDPSVLSKNDKSKQLAVAKRLIEGGTTAGDVRRITQWLQGQSWVSGVDLLLIEKQLGKWRLAGSPGSAPGAPPKLPAGVSWDDVQQWRERRRHGLSNAGDRDRILDELDGKAGQAA